jgi:hypothetical protein
MAQATVSVGSVPTARLRSKAYSALTNMNATSGAVHVITAPEAMDGVTIDNDTANTILVTYTFAAGVTGNAGVAPSGGVTSQTSILLPKRAMTIDFSDHEGSNAPGAVSPLLGVTYKAVQGPAVAAVPANTVVGQTLANAAVVTTGFIATNFFAQ